MKQLKALRMTKPLMRLTTVKMVVTRTLSYALRPEKLFSEPQGNQKAAGDVDYLLNQAGELALAFWSICSECRG